MTLQETIDSTTLLANPLEAWLTALLITSGVFALGLLIRVALAARLRRFARRTENALDDILSGVVDRINLLILLLVALYGGSLWLDLPVTASVGLRRLAILGILLQVGIWASYALKAALEAYVGSTGDDSRREVLALIAVLGDIVVWALLLMLGLESLGFDATALITGLGIGGIAVGLALQSVLKDVFAFLSIVFDRPFSVGDSIVVGDQMGTVERVGMKTTRLRSLTGETLVFGNHDLLSSRIRNFHDLEERRLVVQLGVTYDTTPEELESIPALAQQVVEGAGPARFGRAHLKSFGDSSIDFEIVIQVESSEYQIFMDVQQAVHLGLIRELAAQGIEIAFPTRTIILEPTDALPGPASAPGLVDSSPDTEPVEEIRG